MSDEYKWLFEENIKKLRQKIRFKDRIEYRVGGKLHNIHGPAWVGLQDLSNPTKTPVVMYYINGENIDFNEWSVIVRPLKLKKIIKNIKK